MPPLNRTSTLIDVLSQEFSKEEPTFGANNDGMGLEAEDKVIGTHSLSLDPPRAEKSKAEDDSPPIPDTDPATWNCVASMAQKQFPAGAAAASVCSETPTEPAWRSENDLALEALSNLGIKIRDYGWPTGGYHPPVRVGEDELMQRSESRQVIPKSKSEPLGAS
ncbi:hypothetical protein GYMLUDRAFT_235535 [Collybiopsis luxurians FD-317 M1]|nr:hypothetical protein GYMLUDRAFT_235535 [Collybiopsis luxurians FD-317 M1]